MTLISDSISVAATFVFFVLIFGLLISGNTKVAAIVVAANYQIYGI
jgi:hypothetical protein